MIKKHFQEIKRLFFPRWDREGRWRIRISSRRRGHGHCDTDRRIIEIMVQHDDPDERDCLLIHEICHAVASCGHGKAWQRRIEKAAVRADEIRRDDLAKLLRQEIVNYQGVTESLESAYDTIEDAITENPDLTLRQVKRMIADHYGLLVSEVCTVFRRFKKVYLAYKKYAIKTRHLNEVYLEEGQKKTK